MKTFLKTLAAAAALALPASMSAQAPIDPSVNVSLISQPFGTHGTGFAGTGGGFLANFTVDTPSGPQTFSEYLVWCIDPYRPAEAGNSYSYSAYTAASFAATSFGTGDPMSNPTAADMSKIVSLVSTLQNNWNSLDYTQRADLQGSIWATFAGQAPIIQGDPNADLTGWYVLYGNNNNQTFVYYVDEPAEALLILASVGAFVFMGYQRRRA
ncbi:MAG TPA: hypothetical protein VGE27_12285 [Gemmatimonas sp.]|uniref:hypothetical protein n=1 Tax=Gemmatimonas sp. TaxID=1962908 RepID=UPI002ED84FF5